VLLLLIVILIHDWASLVLLVTINEGLVHIFIIDSVLVLVLLAATVLSGLVVAIVIGR